MQQNNNFRRNNNNKLGVAIFLLVVSAGLTFLSALALILCGVFVARPAIWAQDFTNTSCSIIRHEEKGEVSCDCGSNDNPCSSTYPCVGVIVEYEPGTETNSSLFTSMIYTTEILAYSGGECTVVPSCSRSEYENREDVYETINEHLDVNTTIDCLYYPIKIEVVIVKKIFTTTHVKLSLVLPSIFFIIGCGASFYAFMMMLDLKKKQQQSHPGGIELQKGGFFPGASPFGNPPPPPPPGGQMGYNPGNIPPPPPGMNYGFPPPDNSFQTRFGEQVGNPGMPPPPPSYGNAQNVNTTGYGF